MAPELWIVGVSLIVLAICIWRIAVWFARKPGHAGGPLTSALYRRVQGVRVGFLCLVLVALVAALFLWRDEPFWFALVSVFVAMGAAELGHRLILRRMWRCPSCGHELPTRTRRSGTNPVNTAQCPSCGNRLRVAPAPESPAKLEREP